MVRQEVARIRQEIFGQDEPPFETVEEARKWMESQPETLPLPEELQQKLKALREQALALSEQLPAWCKLSLTEAGERAPLVGGGEWAEYRAASTPELVHLAEEARHLAQATDWQPHQAMAHIVTGKMPLLSTATFRVRMRGTHLGEDPVSRCEVAITIRSPEFRKRDWNVLYGALRRVLGKAQFSARDGEFWVYLTGYAEKHGWPPKGKRSGVRSYWRDFAKAWNAYVERMGPRPGRKAYQDQGADAGSAARKRYERIAKQPALVGPHRVRSASNWNAREAT